MKIEIDVLIDCTINILKKYKNSNGEYINLNKDNYWFLDDNECYNMDKEPATLLVGSLIDDCSELSKINDDSREIGILDLERMASILKFISYAIGNSKDLYL